MLPPAIDYEGVLASATLHEAVLSADGKFLGVRYAVRERQRQQWTSIWRIDDEISFRGQTKRGPWARKIMGHMSEVNLYGWFYGAIVSGNDGCFYTPGGMLEPSSGAQRPLPIIRVSECGKRRKLSAFSGDGRFLFHFWSDESVDKVFMRESKDPERFLCPEFADAESSTWTVSHTGRYLASFTRSSSGIQRAGLKMFDTILRKMQELPLDARVLTMNLAIHRCYCYFSLDETKLFGFLHGADSSTFRMEVLIWEPIGDVAPITNRGSFVISSITSRPQISSLKDESEAWLVLTSERILQKAALRVPELTFSRNMELDEDYLLQAISSSISDDGTRLCLVSFEQKRAKVQILDITSTGALIRHLHLDLAPSESRRKFNASKDLGLIAVGDEVFYLGNEDDSLASTAFITPPLSWRQIAWCFSSCNSYAACTDSAYYSFQSESFISYAHFAVLRVDLISRTSAPLKLPLPDKLLRISADFHPTLPLMLLAYTYNSADEDFVGQNGSPHLHVAIVTLKTMESTSIQILDKNLALPLQMSANVTFN